MKPRRSNSSQTTMPAQKSGDMHILGDWGTSRLYVLGLCFVVLLLAYVLTREGKARR